MSHKIEYDFPVHHDMPDVHIVSTTTLVVVWVVLMILTALTVFVAQYNFGVWATPIALIIASVKASLVLLFFMHLKYDLPMFRWMFLAVLVTAVIFIGLTFVDTYFRYRG